MEANQVGQPRGFSAVGDRPHFEALRQVWRATTAIAVGAVVKFEPCTTTIIKLILLLLLLLLLN